MSEWNKRIDTRANDMAHGITFHMWERTMENCRGEAAFDTKKLHLEGKVSLTLAENQHKYGNELIAQIFGTGVEIKDRRDPKYNRIQVYLGQFDEKTAVMLEDMAKTIREILNKNKND